MLQQINGSDNPRNDNRRLVGSDDPRIAKRVMAIAFGALGVLVLIKLGFGDRVLA